MSKDNGLCMHLARVQPLRVPTQLTHVPEFLSFMGSPPRVSLQLCPPPSLLTPGTILSVLPGRLLPGISSPRGPPPTSHPAPGSPLGKGRENSPQWIRTVGVAGAAPPGDLPVDPTRLSHSSYSGLDQPGVPPRLPTPPQLTLPGSPGRGIVLLDSL